MFCNRDHEEVRIEEDKEPTQAQVEMATNLTLLQITETIILGTDKSSGVQQNENIDNDTDLPLEDIEIGSLQRTVLGYIFHFRDQAKLPMHHKYKDLYFCALRAGNFIMVKSNVDDVKEVLASKPGTSWNKKMAFDFGYITQRVKRQVPPPEVLHSRLKVVYEFLKIKKIQRQALFYSMREIGKKLQMFLIKSKMDTHQTPQGSQCTYLRQISMA